MSHKRFSEGNKKLHTKRQKEPEETIEETSGFVKPEWANKRPNSILDYKNEAESQPEHN
jgi:hypothetical protein